MTEDHNTAASPAMTPQQIGAILRRHKGSQTQIADSLGLRASTVNTWLTGKTTSARIAEAAQVKARELLTIEKATAETLPRIGSINVSPGRTTHL